jgi:hypothetical protein
MLPERGKVKLLHKAINNATLAKCIQKEVSLCIERVCSRFFKIDIIETTQHSKEPNIEASVS